MDARRHRHHLARGEGRAVGGEHPEDALELAAHHHGGRAGQHQCHPGGQRHHHLARQVRARALVLQRKRSLHLPVAAQVGERAGELRLPSPLRLLLLLRQPTARPAVIQRHLGATRAGGARGGVGALLSGALFLARQRVQGHAHQRRRVARHPLQRQRPGAAGHLGPLGGGVVTREEDHHRGVQRQWGLVLHLAVRARGPREGGLHGHRHQAVFRFQQQRSRRRPRPGGAGPRSAPPGVHQRLRGGGRGGRGGQGGVALGDAPAQRQRGGVQKGAPGGVKERRRHRRALHKLHLVHLAEVRVLLSGIGTLLQVREEVHVHARGGAAPHHHRLRHLPVRPPSAPQGLEHDLVLARHPAVQIEVAPHAEDLLRREPQRRAGPGHRHLGVRGRAPPAVRAPRQRGGDVALAHAGAVLGHHPQVREHHHLPGGLVGLAIHHHRRLHRHGGAAPCRREALHPHRRAGALEPRLGQLRPRQGEEGLARRPLATAEVADPRGLGVRGGAVVVALAGGVLQRQQQQLALPNLQVARLVAQRHPRQRRRHLRHQLVGVVPVVEVVRRHHRRERRPSARVRRGDQRPRGPRLPRLAQHRRHTRPQGIQRQRAARGQAPARGGERELLRKGGRERRQPEARRRLSAPPLRAGGVDHPPHLPLRVAPGARGWCDDNVTPARRLGEERAGGVTAMSHLRRLRYGQGVLLPAALALCLAAPFGGALRLALRLAGAW
eukprot:1194197-Prorocentrum_minimum.AAC.2